MRNIINSPNHEKRDFKDCFSKEFRVVIESKIIFSLIFFLTAKDKLAIGSVVDRACSYSLQNPIKNIIAHPE
jgi:hypothetical protein